MRLRRRPFAELVDRQLALFEEEQAALLRECEVVLRSYRDAPADTAEARYGAFVDLVDTGRDALEEIRDTFARTLDEPAAETYRSAFDERARKRFPHLGFELR
jgi:hypothetical protein